MESSFIYRGKPKNKEEDLAEAMAFAQEMRDSGTKRVEGEQEKSERQLEDIKFINTYLAEVFSQINLSYEPIPDERIHFLSNEIFQKTFPSHTGEIGFSISEEGAVFINLEPESDEPRLIPLRVFSTALHESIHYQAKLKTTVTPQDAQIEVHTYRSGYRMSHSGNHSFVGLNEGVVSLLEGQIILKHKEELAQRFSLTDEEVDRVINSSYPDYIELVEHLMLKIAALRNEGPHETYLRMVGEQFTGNMMHLRDIEKLYGRDSLRLLSRLGAESPELDERIWSFFMNDDEAERSKILESINEH